MSQIANAWRPGRASLGSIVLGLIAVLLAFGLVFALEGGVASAQGGSEQTQSCTNRAQFVADVTVPDGAVVNPGASFVKTWRLRNSGTCAWGAGYTIVFVGGVQMGATSPSALPATIPPGAVVDLSLSMVAPTTPGTYRSNWSLRSSSGQTFGVGSNGATPFYVQIVVRQPSNQPLRITFQPGATSATVPLTLVSGQPSAFVLRASAGQTMRLTFVSPVSGVAVRDPANQPLAPVVSDGARTWQYSLPRTGDYVISVTGAGPNSMTVQIPPRTGPTPTPTPIAPLQRITFPPGADSASVSMQLAFGQAKGFILGAGASQTMFLTFASPVSSLQVRAPGNQLLAPAYSDGAYNWQYVLPRTGDYTILVTGSGYNRMTVRIPPLGAPTATPPPSVQRITFAPGADTAVVNIQFVPDESKSFVLRAGAGQTMFLSFDVPVSYVDVRGPGNQLLAPFYSDGAYVWQFALPRTGDYVIVVSGFGQNRMTVTIPPR